jgi:hypothetical protein
VDECKFEHFDELYLNLTFTDLLLFISICAVLKILDQVSEWTDTLWQGYFDFDKIW